MKAQKYEIWVSFDDGKPVKVAEAETWEKVNVLLAALEIYDWIPRWAVTVRKVVEGEREK